MSAFTRRKVDSGGTLLIQFADDEQEFAAKLVGVVDVGGLGEPIVRVHWLQV